MFVGQQRHSLTSGPCHPSREQLRPDPGSDPDELARTPELRRDCRKTAASSRFRKESTPDFIGRRQAMQAAGPDRNAW